MKLKEFVTGPSLSKKLLTGTALACCGAMSLGVINLQYKVGKSVDLDAQADAEAQTLHAEAKVKGIEDEVSNKVRNCMVAGALCKAEADTQIANADSSASRLYLNFVSGPNTYLSCAEEKLSCVQGINTQE